MKPPRIEVRFFQMSGIGKSGVAPTNTEAYAATIAGLSFSRVKRRVETSGH
jgi:hypothetical protein